MSSLTANMSKLGDLTNQAMILESCINQKGGLNRKSTVCVPFPNPYGVTYFSLRSMFYRLRFKLMIIWQITDHGCHFFRPNRHLQHVVASNRRSYVAMITLSQLFRSTENLRALTQRIRDLISKRETPSEVVVVVLFTKVSHFFIFSSYLNFFYILVISFFGIILLTFLLDLSKSYFFFFLSFFLFDHETSYIYFFFYNLEFIFSILELSLISRSLFQTECQLHG